MKPRIPKEAGFCVLKQLSIQGASMKAVRYRLLGIMVAVSLTVVGCATVPYRSSPPENTLLPQEESSVTVNANGPWRSSGVIVKTGDQYQIKATGLWRHGPWFWDPWVGPDGVGALTVWNIVKGFTDATLIAKIGEGPPFAVGGSLLLKPDQEGLLYFKMNKNVALRGAQGKVDVTIKNVSTPVLALPKGKGETEGKELQAYQAQGQKWAVIIGISTYKDTRIAGLRYASTDAKAFHEWLISPQGGGYAPSRTRLFLNSEATAQSIRNVLFNWLKQALEEDMITIYFAGHGSPESPDSPNNLFLLPFDANYDDVASTGFPMWDIETALKRFIKAKKVVVIADACHAGGVGQAFDIARRANRGVEINPISSGLQNLSKIGDGVAVISASDDKQYSQEGMAWGGGHGVFTYFLLKGLNGDADYNKDGHVTLGELIPYLSEKVRRETKNAQSPTVAGKFDPALSIGK
jgi:hypothetical protein